MQNCLMSAMLRFYILSPMVVNSFKFSTSRSLSIRTDLFSSIDDKNLKDSFSGTRLFVVGIPLNVDWKMLKDHFRTVGSVVYASVSCDPVTKKSKGCGIVQFETTQEAIHAITVMNGKPLNGVNLLVRQDLQERSRRLSKKAEITTPSIKNNHRIERTEKSDSHIKKVVQSNSNVNSSKDNEILDVPYMRLDTKSDQITSKQHPIWSYIATSSDVLLSQEDQDYIQALVLERESCRNDKNFTRSDEIRLILRREKKVQLDDVKKQWRVLVPK